MGMIKLFRIFKETIIEVKSLTEMIIEKEETPDYYKRNQDLQVKDYIMIGLFFLFSIAFLLALVIVYPNDILMICIKIYSCTLVLLLLGVCIIFIIILNSNYKKSLIKCITVLTKICIWIGTVLIFFFKLFQSAFFFHPKRENTAVYMVILLFLDFQAIIIILSAYGFVESTILKIIEQFITLSIDKYAVSYGIVILLCIELIGAINYYVLNKMRQREINIIKSELNEEMINQITMKAFHKSFEEELDHDWKYIEYFCWLITLGLLVLFFAIGIFFPEILFLEDNGINKDRQSAFFNVVALVSLIILIFDKRVSWLMNSK